MGEALRANEESMVELNQSSDGVYDAKEKGISAIKDLINTTAKVEESAMKVSEVIVRTDEGAKKIDEASTMIKSIAGQTNLLALNAAIEAARQEKQERALPWLLMKSESLLNRQISLLRKSW